MDDDTLMKTFSDKEKAILKRNEEIKNFKEGFDRTKEEVTKCISQESDSEKVQKLIVEQQKKSLNLIRKQINSY